MPPSPPLPPFRPQVRCRRRRRRLPCRRSNPGWSPPPTAVPPGDAPSAAAVNPADERTSASPPHTRRGVGPHRVAATKNKAEAMQACRRTRRSAPTSSRGSVHPNEWYECRTGTTRRTTATTPFVQVSADRGRANHRLRCPRGPPPAPPPTRRRCRSHRHAAAIAAAAALIPLRPRRGRAATLGVAQRPARLHVHVLAPLSEGRLVLHWRFDATHLHAQLRAVHTGRWLAVASRSFPAR